jgi:hypothetical protein
LLPIAIERIPWIAEVAELLDSGTTEELDCATEELDGATEELDAATEELDAAPSIYTLA